MAPLGCTESAALPAELRALALERWARCGAATRARLLEASRLGDRRRAVEAVLQALAAGDGGAAFEVRRGCREAKDEARARALLAAGGDPSEALAWAPPAGPLFGRILAGRARRAFEAGELARCARDCRWALRRGDEERAVEALALQAACLRDAEPARARGLLHEAMRRINALAPAGPGASAEPRARLLRACRPPARRGGGGGGGAGRGAAPVVPRLLGGAHAWLGRCSEALGLSRCPAGRRGRLLYARRDLRPGSVLIVDRAFSFSSDLSALRANCAGCQLSLRRAGGATQVPCEACATVRFCSEECRRLAWDKFHRHECPVFGYFYDSGLQGCGALLAYRTLVTAALRVEDERLVVDADFVRLHENDSVAADDVASQQTMDKYEPEDYRTVFGLQTHGCDREPSENLLDAIHSIFLAKCLLYSLTQQQQQGSLATGSLATRQLETTLAVGFLHIIQAIKCNAYEIVENVRNEETKILEPRSVGGALYTSVSLTNHSCYPNVVRHSFPNGVVVVTSLRFIAQGEEILDCYGQHFLEHDRDHRRRHLKIKYHFECECEACLSDWPNATMLQSHEIRFKCKRCSKRCRELGNAIECTECGKKANKGKLYKLLRGSVEERRIAALTKMYDGCYDDALPLLLEHANCIGKILSEPSLEAVKTQQSIIQCLNAMSCVSHY